MSPEAFRGLFIDSVWRMIASKITKKPFLMEFSLKRPLVMVDVLLTNQSNNQSVSQSLND